MSVEPPPVDGQIIVGVVEYYARKWPDKTPPMFRSVDVLPLLQGNDREYEAAMKLLDLGCVHYGADEAATIADRPAQTAKDVEYWREVKRKATADWLAGRIPPSYEV